MARLIRAMMAKSALACSVLAVWCIPAVAHAEADVTERTVWTTWDLSPEIVIPTLLVLAIYLTGMHRRRTSKVKVPWWRHALFLSGVTTVFLCLSSPLDALADHLFWVHQIQHLVLRMIGPMLVTLSWPQGVLTAGLPSPVRRAVLGPTVSNGVVRGIFGFLTQPVINTLLFILALYAWEIPRFHDYALLHEPVHYLMHVTMLAAGLLFFWQVFDRRAPALPTAFDDEIETSWFSLGRGRSTNGLGYGVRLMMLWFAILSGILIGSYTTLKTTVLYPAYDILGRFYGFTPIEDEKLGGIILWIPSSMMFLLAILIVIHLWGLHETRLDLRRTSPSVANSNSAALLYPVTGAALVERARPKNRVMAVGFSAFAAMMFAIAIMSGVMQKHLSNDIAGQPASHTAVRHAANLGSLPIVR